MLWTIALILFVLWMVGLLVHLGGALIHLLLVAAVIFFAVHLVNSQRRVT